MKRPLISIVSPVYHGEKMVAELVRRNKESLSAITEDFEIILVNDASPDNSWTEIEKQCRLDPRVKGLDLSRNFGQHYAITAGLRYASGEWIVVMDCDLQNRPEEIPNLYRKAREGFDIVFARRARRKDGFLKRQSSVLFHRLFRLLSGLETDSAIANFGIYRRCVIAEFNKMPERVRFFPVQIGYLGFKTATVDVVHAERANGKTSYRLLSLLRLGFDVMLSNSNKPLQFAVGFGFFMSALSFALALYNVIAKCAGIICVPGYTTTIFSIWFIGGLLLFVVGIVGLYVGKIFDQVKGRPLFVVRTHVNVGENAD
ncbi:MAG: glycosyltransferase family 2 protein [Kiritimatiellae bacterium]|nr:glycosyltransferase family 2 protein [Kiritimatiellia bacterium]